MLLNKRSAAGLLFLLTITGSAQALSQATYSYTGVNPMTNANGVYSGAELVNASFTIPEPLPAGATTDVSATITSFTATDGIQTITESNLGRLNAEFTTDADANIESWFFGVQPAPIATALGDPFSTIRTQYSDNGTLFDGASLSSPCNVVSPDSCSLDSIDYGDLGDSAATGLIFV